MASSIIDSLVVTLGLNAQGFETGIAKAGEGVAGLARRFAGMFLAIEGFGGAINYASRLNKELTQFYWTSRNLSISTTDLSRWAEVAAQAGGRAEDAAASFTNLRQAIFGQQMMGQMSPNLVMLARMRVPYLNPDGSPRDAHAVEMDLARNAMQMYPGDANSWRRAQIAQAAGFVGGEANAIAAGPATLQTFWTRAVADQKIDAKAAADAAKAAAAAARLEYQFKNDMVKLLDQLLPALSGLLSDASKLLAGVAGGASQASADYQKAKGFVAKMTGGAKAGDNAAWNLGTQLGNFFGLTRGLRNNNPLNIRAVGNQPRDAQGYRVFPTLAEGFMASEGQLDRYEGRGLNTIRGIVSRWASGDPAATIQNYIKSVSGRMGVSPDAPITGAMFPALMAAMAYFEDKYKFTAGQVQQFLAPPNVPPSARGTITHGGGAAAGKTVILNLQGMVINAPQAKNANDIAASIGNALRNKLLVSTADVALA